MPLTPDKRASIIALAMERWDLHKRIALRIIRVVGSKPSRLVLGFMLATAFLSMWISNTATAIMMLAIGLAVIKQTEDSYGTEKTANLTVALLLGIAYSASIGGVATLVGTPPNLALVRLFELSFPGAAVARGGDVEPDSFIHRGTLHDQARSSCDIVHCCQPGAARAGTICHARRRH